MKSIKLYKSVVSTVQSNQYIVEQEINKRRLEVRKHSHALSRFRIALLRHQVVLEKTSAFSFGAETYDINKKSPGISQRNNKSNKIITRNSKE